MEQLDCNLLLRGSVGLEVDASVGVARRNAPAPEARLPGKDYPAVHRNSTVQGPTAGDPCRVFNKLACGL